MTLETFHQASHQLQKAPTPQFQLAAAHTRNRLQHSDAFAHKALLSTNHMIITLNNVNFNQMMITLQGDVGIFLLRRQSVFNQQSQTSAVQLTANAR